LEGRARDSRPGELRTEDIATEVFFLPAANHAEKGGTFTQTQRLLQWHHKAIRSAGSMPSSELEFFYELGKRDPGQAIADSDRPARPALLDLTWDYPSTASTERSIPEAVLTEINGMHLSGDQGRPDAVLDGFV
jgi:formate dehydrogenase major subunit